MEIQVWSNEESHIFQKEIGGWIKSIFNQSALYL